MTPSVAVISLEPWDDIWRRNQHFASRLVARGDVRKLLFVDPPSVRSRKPWSPLPRITVFRPTLYLPRRVDNLATVAFQVRRAIDAFDSQAVVWVNDPAVGALLAGDQRDLVYDVTDDWRFASQAPRPLRRILAAEEVLAYQARTIVCSDELFRRWKSRYGVEARIVHNAADVAAIRSGIPRTLDEEYSHLGYIGTLHEDRIDLDLLISLARQFEHSQIHLVGPNHLTADHVSKLRPEPRIVFHNHVSHEEVPDWLTSFDVLISPHRITPFTMSLDAIKTYEYLATSRPIVATPTSGFQDRSAPGLEVAANDNFRSAVQRVLGHRESCFVRSVSTWDERVEEFASALLSSSR